MFKPKRTAIAIALCIATSAAHAQNSITYQGSLTDTGANADGNYDLRFTLWTDATPGAPDTQIGSTFTSPFTAVTNGVFTVNLNLDDAAFQTNQLRYLQIEIREPGDPTYTTLTPRQQVTYTPRSFYAQQAQSANLALGVDLPITAFGSDADLNGFNALFHIGANGTTGYALRGDGKTAGVLGFGTVGLSFPPISSGSGVVGISDVSGLYGSSGAGRGITAISLDATGGYFETRSNTASEYALHARSTSGSSAGLFEIDEPGSNRAALIARTDSTLASAFAVHGIIESTSPGSFSSAIRGENRGLDGFGIGVYGSHTGTGWGIYGVSGSGGYAGYFSGDVHVSGNLSKGGGSFKIDHPLDPANRYLSHSFVESPDMKNIYDGVITLDKDGQSAVTLPEYFNALNRDFRYQLTCIGGYAPVYISSEIAGRTFSIAGGTPGLKVSWQVTGIRQDEWANEHRIQTEVDKRGDEQGRYLHPELYNQPAENGIGYIRPPAPQN